LRGSPCPRRADRTTLRVDVVAATVRDDGRGVGVEKVSEGAEATVPEEIVVTDPGVVLLVGRGAHSDVDGLRDAAARIMQDDGTESRRQGASLMGVVGEDDGERQLDLGPLRCDARERLLEGVEPVAERREDDEDLASARRSRWNGARSWRLNRSALRARSTHPCQP